MHNIKIGDKDVKFVRSRGEVVYPNYVKDGLVLWYDFSGMENSGVNRGIAEDLSGNGNDGFLENFAFDAGSGYDSNSYLEFDNVDDFITIPELNLDVNNFTVAVDGEVLSYRGDNVAKINENGLEIGGRNYYIASKMPVSPVRVKNIDGFTALKQNTSPFVDTRYALDNLEPETKYNIYFKIVDYEEDFDVSGILITLSKSGSVDSVRCYVDSSGICNLTFVTPLDLRGWSIRYRFETESDFTVSELKIEKGTIPTDWSPAPEDFQTTKITPIFSNKIKTLMYWNRALTDTELQEVYNVQKHRI